MTAPRSIRRAGRTFCTRRSSAGVTSTRTSRFDSGCKRFEVAGDRVHFHPSVFERHAGASRVRLGKCPDATLDPRAASRPTARTARRYPPAETARSGEARFPPRCRAWLSRSNVRPSGGSPGNLRSAKAALKSATPCAPGRSSAPLKPRPRSMDAPSNGRRSAESIFAGTRSGSPAPVTVTFNGRNAAIPANDCARSRQAS